MEQMGTLIIYVGINSKAAIGKWRAIHTERSLTIAQAREAKERFISENRHIDATAINAMWTRREYL